MSYVLSLYLAGALLITARLSLYAASRLGRDAWRERPGDILGQILLTSLLWPLCLLKPKDLWQDLICPDRLFREHEDFLSVFRRDQAEWEREGEVHARERQRFVDAPPPCARTLRYAQNTAGEAGAHGEFHFAAADIEAWLRLPPEGVRPPTLDVPTESVLNWLGRRDDHREEATEPPAILGDFARLADALLRSGKGEAYCARCGEHYSASALLADDDAQRYASWNRRRLRCPAGHALLITFDPRFRRVPYLGPLDREPPCGRRLRYAQAKSDEGRVDGEFRFAAADVEAWLSSRPELESRGIQDNDDFARRNWLDRRDENREEAWVPASWRGFDRVADELMRAGKGEAYCGQCGIGLTPAELVTDDDCGQVSGWQYHRLRCPAGHTLLCVPTLHIMLPPPELMLLKKDA